MPPEVNTTKKLVWVNVKDGITCMRGKTGVPRPCNNAPHFLSHYQRTTLIHCYCSARTQF
jgi:hypothetical protein